MVNLPTIKQRDKITNNYKKLSGNAVLEGFKRQELGAVKSVYLNTGAAVGDLQLQFRQLQNF